MKCLARLLLALGVLFSPGLALACSVCSGAGEESRGAFIGTTVFLSALPLVMIGALVWWIWRRSQANEPPVREAPADLRG